MTRPKKTRINKDHSKVTNIDPRTRGLVECTCLLHCNSSKFVDPRTFEKHQKKIKQLELFQTVAFGFQGRERVIRSAIKIKILHIIILLMMMKRMNITQMIMNQLIYQKDKNTTISFVMH